jgi:hypothetical protein
MILMEEFNNKPEYPDPDELNAGIGKVLWGKDGKSFSMGRLIRSFIKKRIFGGK